MASKAWAVLAIVGIGVACANAQEAPVTQAEMFASVGKCETALCRVLQMPVPKARTGSTKPATRLEMFKEFGRLFDEFKTKFKVTPRPVRIDPLAIEQRCPEEVITLATKLAKWGCVAPVGPLVVGPKDTLSIDEFGDALGFFFTRVAGLSHTPLIKWSPYLQPDGAPKGPLPDKASTKG